MKKGRFSDSTQTAVVNLESDHSVATCRAWLEVKDVMCKDVVVIGPDETAISAAKMMSENNVSCIVVMDNGSVEGILTERDLLKKMGGDGKFNNKITAAEVMSRSVESVSPDLSILNASEIMETKNIRRLPILAERQLVGIVTQTDLTQALTSYGMWKDVAEIMSRDAAVVQTKTVVAEAAEIMASRNISCIVVLEGNNVCGVVTETDILKKVIVPRKNPARTKIDEIMSFPVMVVSPSSGVFSAHKTMEKLHIRRLIVMENDLLCGILSQTDVFRAMKNKLQKEEEKNIRLLNQSKSNIYTLDLNGMVTYVNSAFMKLLEISDRAELNDQPFLSERFWLNPAERARCLKKLKKGNVEIEDLRLKTSKGRDIYVSIFSTFTKNIHGQINGTQGILYDITDRKRAELSVTKAYHDAREANCELKQAQSQLIQNEKLASIGQLAAGVAHEMNTPVGFVASNFETLENYVTKIRDLLVKYEELTRQIGTLGKAELRNKATEIDQFRDDTKMDFIVKDICELFDDSREGLERVTNIVQNLRDFSRVDQPGSRDEYDINKGIEATLVVVRNEIKYNTDVKTELSELPLIFCHPNQLNQVFLNILLNATQAIKSQERDDRGTITIRTYATETGVVCEISDDGPGIPPDKISKIFDPFFTTKPVGKGTGLGLSVSYDIIANKHNGQLLVESTLGEGTKFIIKLPTSREQPANGQEMIMERENK